MNPASVERFTKHVKHNAPYFATPDQSHAYYDFISRTRISGDRVYEMVETYAKRAFKETNPNVTVAGMTHAIGMDVLRPQVLRWLRSEHLDESWTDNVVRTLLDRSRVRYAVMRLVEDKRLEMGAPGSGSRSATYRYLPIEVIEARLNQANEWDAKVATTKHAIRSFVEAANAMIGRGALDAEDFHIRGKHAGDPVIETSFTTQGLADFAAILAAMLDDDEGADA